MYKISKVYIPIIFTNYDVGVVWSNRLVFVCQHYATLVESKTNNNNNRQCIKFVLFKNLFMCFFFKNFLTNNLNLLVSKNNNIRNVHPNAVLGFDSQLVSRKIKEKEERGK